MKELTEAQLNNLSPTARRYYRTLQTLPEGAILFLRIGDFYETFFDVAREVAERLGTALTHRTMVPMTGVAYPLIERAYQMLTEQGKQVFLAETVNGSVQLLPSPGEEPPEDI